MQPYQNLNSAGLAQELRQVRQDLDAWKARGLKLNMARGKPGRAQLDMVSDILTVLTRPEQCLSDGIDARNYGELAGLPGRPAVLGRGAGLPGWRRPCGRKQPA